MKRPSTEFTQKFIQGLAAHGLTYEDVKQNWKYAGGDTGRHSNYYDMAFSHLQEPEYTDRCVCDHVIQENCYITDGTDMIAIGNCCIKKFMNKSGRTCDKCGEPHKNRVVNRCNICRQGCCDSCGKNINSEYKKCYECIRGEELSSRERRERNMDALISRALNRVAVVV